MIYVFYNNITGNISKFEQKSMNPDGSLSDRIPTSLNTSIDVVAIDPTSYPDIEFSTVGKLKSYIVSDGNLVLAPVPVPEPDPV